jgi:hypothetical protein
VNLAEEKGSNPELEGSNDDLDSEPSREECIKSEVLRRVSQQDNAPKRSQSIFKGTKNSGPG